MHAKPPRRRGIMTMRWARMLRQRGAEQISSHWRGDRGCEEAACRRAWRPLVAVGHLLPRHGVYKVHALPGIALAPSWPNLQQAATNPSHRSPRGQAPPVDADLDRPLVYLA